MPNNFWGWLTNSENDKSELEPVRQVPNVVVQTKTKRKKAPKTGTLSFADYIGQTKAKDILKAYITSKKQLPHILIHGSAGYGKTTLARIIANETGLPYTEIMAQSIADGECLVNLVLNSKGGIIFIDEVHGLRREDVEIIYSMMEDFKYNGKDIKPFTLIGATTEYGELLKSRRPFVDRFKINIELDLYTLSEMESLLTKHATRLKLLATSNIGINTLANNCKLVPRTAIRLLEASECFGGDYKKALYAYNIVANSLTEKDIKTLKYLTSVKHAGIESIASFLNTPKQSYQYEVEPYLLQVGYIVRVAQGRQITQLGRQFLANITK